MNNAEWKDERVIEERRKIQSRGYSLLVTALLAGVLVQQLFLKAPFAQYAMEFYALIGCGIYQMIANTRRGFNIWTDQRSSRGQTLLGVLAGGIVAVLCLAVFTEMRDTEGLILFLVVFVAGSLGLRLLLAHLTENKKRQLEKELDDEEDSVHQ